MLITLGESASSSVCSTILSIGREAALRGLSALADISVVACQHSTDIQSVIPMYRNSSVHLSVCHELILCKNDRTDHAL